MSLTTILIIVTVVTWCVAWFFAFRDDFTRMAQARWPAIKRAIGLSRE
jgi:hypothetical protein